MARQRVWHRILEKATNKEMKTVQVEFGFKEEGNCVPVGCQEINFHMIFDVNMEFTRKKNFVAG